MKNLYLIPTDKPSRLFIDVDDNKLKITIPIGGEHMMNQNIYITSDEEIKVGDWVLCGGISLLKVKKEITYDAIKLANKDFETKKIILTTDQDLIKDGVQAIDDEFLKWFVKNPSCESVEIRKEMYMPQSNGKISDGKITHEISLDQSQNTLPYYKIIIPKEEQSVEEYEQQGLKKIIFSI